MKNIKPFLLFLGLLWAGCLTAQTVDFENIQIVNEEELDFSPVPYSNGLMYTSSKGNRFLQCPPQNGQQYTDLYYSTINDDGTFNEPVRLRGGVNGKYNDGVPTFTADGNTMIFTRNNLLGKNDSNVIDLKIYFADLVDGQWKNVRPYAHNSEDWSTAHPTLSPDGNLLVFSSNHPGSTGGSMDLWASRKIDDDVWSLPFNLGPDVNTTGIEFFPYFDSDGNLFFSSNGHGGEGGHDIFAAVNPDPENEDEWTMMGNIGTPFNTPADEVGFAPIAGATKGYLASNNGDFSGAEGMDDIYKWDRDPGMMDALIQVVDKGTGKPLENATVAISPSAFKNPSYQKYTPVLDRLYGEEGATVMLEPVKLNTDAEGMLPPMRVYEGGNFDITAEKQGYDTEMRAPTTEELTENPVYIIPLERQFATLTVIVVEDPGEARIPLADISVRNKRTGEIVDLTGDGEGTANTQIDCNDDYEITARKAPYESNSVELVDYELDCSDGEVTVIVPLKKPIIVTLEPIFYDFDRYYIRKKDAAPTLDNLVEILNQYPTLTISLNGSTDARGASTYNEWLAEQRALSAKKYLEERDIDPSRISTKKFGEEGIINDCVDDVYCPEPAHQLNRRVDVMPVSHDEPGVIFQTRDISTMTVESDR